MNHAVAVGGPPARIDVAPGRAWLWLDGVPAPEVSVVAFEETAPLGRRRVTLRPPEGMPCPTAAWALAAEPMCFDDGSVRWRPLAAGRLAAIEHRDRAGRATRAWRLVDAWADRLDRSLAPAWSLDGSTLVRGGVEGLRVGADANRSAGRWSIAGNFVYVPTTAPGEPWRVGDVLGFLAAATGWSLRSSAVAPHRLHAALTDPLALDRPLGRILEAMLRPHGLGLMCELRMRGAKARHALTLVDPDATPRQRLPRDGAGSAVVQYERRWATPAATRWIARGGRHAVEATFALVPGWDRTLESAADSAYARGQSSDFARYRDVFRRWVLNEDGAFTGSPYDAGPAYDTAALFGRSDVPRRPLRFGPTLSLDAAGAPMPPVVETRWDGAAAWAPAAGRVVVLDDRAGVYFDDDALDAAYLAAAKAGTLEVRVTATLTDPYPLEAERWDGNPFAGAAATRSLDAGEAFTHRRVDPSSVLHGQGETHATDDRAALATWLDEAIRRRPEADDTTTLELSGRHTTNLRALDGVLLDPDLGDLADHRGPPRQARVTRVRRVLAGDRNPRTTITLSL